jgi:serine/threonine protein phosphatase PrpC
LKLTAYGVTHPGRVRPNNEDALLWDVPAGLFMVADGMGGHQAGEVASKMAVDTVQSFLEASRGDHDLTWPFGFDPALSMNANRLVTAVRLANRKVYQAGEDKPDLAGMGTTIVVALVDGATLTFCGVGDSRIYLLSGTALQQITHDDSWVATVLARDPEFDRAQLAHHPMRHVLTNVLGAREDTEVEVGERPLASGEQLLLCSDGLYGGLDDASMQILLAGPGKLDELGERLVATSLERGGTDNITVVLVRAVD